MADATIGIRVKFDARTGELRVATRDIKRLRQAVDQAGKEMAQADRAAAGFFGRFRRAHGGMLKFVGTGGVLYALAFAQPPVQSQGQPPAHLAADRTTSNPAMHRGCGGADPSAAS